MYATGMKIWIPTRLDDTKSIYTHNHLTVIGFEGKDASCGKRKTEGKSSWGPRACGRIDRREAR